MSTRSHKEASQSYGLSPLPSENVVPGTNNASTTSQSTITNTMALPDRTTSVEVNMQDDPSNESMDGSESLFVPMSAPHGNSANPAARSTPHSETMDCFGGETRKLIQTIQKLEELSIDSTLQSLPKFVVVGDQSHGKSSIVEAICDITLPRSTGTCTRCPFQITTSCVDAGAPWKCRVSLIHRYAYVPGPRSGRKTSPWQDQNEYERIEFTTVHERHDLDRVLRLAQAAILNPMKNPQEILRSNNPGQDISEKFSPNIIRLDVEAPGIPEISFFDLPGAINMTHDMNDHHLVAFIEELISNYVQDEKTLILLAVAANQDVNNSTAYRYVHNADADSRCMGVLTKLDMSTIDDQSLSKILSGEWFPLAHGWYTTRQPGQDELDAGITHAQARTVEDQFFATQRPWCSSLHKYSEKFGTRNLQKELSKKLTEHILSELPEIMDRVNSRLQAVDTELRKFPEQAKSPCQAVTKEIDRLQALVVQRLLGHGHGTEKEFRSQYKHTIRQFSTQLGASEPEVILSSPGYKPPVVSLDDNDEGDMEIDDTPSKCRKKNNGERSSTPKQMTTPQRKNPRPTAIPRPHSKSNQGNTVAPPLKKPSFQLDELKKMYDYGSVTSDIPDQMDAGVTENLSISFVKPWSSMVETLLSYLKLNISKMLQASIDDVLASRNQTKLYEQAQTAMVSYLREVMEEVTGHVRYALACETHRAITYDIEIVKRLAERRKEFKRKREVQRATESFDKSDEANNKITTPAERSKKIADPAWVESNLGPDEYARQLDWIAQPLVYYEIASRRFVDVVANNLEYGLIGGLEKGLKDRLETDLRVTEPEYCSMLLAEDPQRERERARLLAEREKLVKALNELETLPMQASNSD